MNMAKHLNSSSEAICTTMAMSMGSPRVEAPSLLGNVFHHFLLLTYS